MAKEIYNLNGREEFLSSVKLADLQNHVTKLLGLLRERELPDYVVDRINEGVTKINEFKGDYKELGKLILKFSRETLTFLEKELKLVSKNHYQNQWMAIGLAAFGVPLGVAFGTSLGNMAFMGDRSANWSCIRLGCRCIYG